MAIYVTMSRSYATRRLNYMTKANFRTVVEDTLLCKTWSPEYLPRSAHKQDEFPQSINVGCNNVVSGTSARKFSYHIRFYDNSSYINGDGSKYSSKFFPGFIAHFNEFHEQEFQCQDGSTPKFRGGGFDHVVAVIGDQSSSVTIQVSEMCPTEAQNCVSFSWISNLKFSCFRTILS
jgi:hypothetical protein